MKVGKQEKEEERNKERKKERKLLLSLKTSHKHCALLHSYWYTTGSIPDRGLHVFEHKMRHFVLTILNMATQMNLKESRVSF